MAEDVSTPELPPPPPERAPLTGKFVDVMERFISVEDQYIEDRIGYRQETTPKLLKKLYYRRFREGPLAAEAAEAWHEEIHLLESMHFEDKIHYAVSQPGMVTRVVLRENPDGKKSTETTSVYRVSGGKVMVREFEEESDNWPYNNGRNPWLLESVDESYQEKDAEPKDVEKIIADLNFLADNVEQSLKSLNEKKPA